MIMMINDIVVYSFIITYCIVGLATTGKWQMFVNQAFAIFSFVVFGGFLATRQFLTSFFSQCKYFLTQI